MDNKKYDSFILLKYFIFEAVKLPLAHCAFYIFLKLAKVVADNKLFITNC